MRRTFIATLGITVGLFVAAVVVAGRDSSGTYSRPTGNPVTAGTPITATWANTLTSDIATELTDSLSRSGKGGMSAPLRTANGSVSAPSLSFTNDTDTGSYLAAVGDFRTAVAGADVLKLTTSGLLLTGTADIATIDRAGTIGIGTTSGTTVTIGRSGQTTTMASTVDAATIDRAGTIGIGTTSGTTVTIGRSGQQVSFPGTLSVQMETIGLALGTGWVAGAQLTVRRTAGLVVVRGYFTAGASSAFSSIATFPEGSRPPQTISFLGTVVDSSSGGTYVGQFLLTDAGVLSLDKYDPSNGLVTPFTIAADDIVFFLATFPTA